MFTIEKELGPVKPAGGRRVADASRQASLTLVTPATIKGDSLFLLTWEDRQVAITTTSQEIVDEWGGSRSMYIYVRLAPAKQPRMLKFGRLSFP
jgi:hypothetical protein